jgi:hypothetical protein
MLINEILNLDMALVWLQEYGEMAMIIRLLDF